MAQGAYSEARDHLTAARDTYTDIGNRLGEANAQSELGHVDAKVGANVDAAARLRDAAGIYRAIGHTKEARQAEAEADQLAFPVRLAPWSAGPPGPSVFQPLGTAAPRGRTPKS